MRPVTISGHADVYSEPYLPMDRAMSDAWREAGAKLGIRVVAPCPLELPDGGTVEVEAFLPDFGGPRGAVVVPLEDEVRGKRLVVGAWYLSLLGPGYRRFDEALFRQTLDDWGWFGAEPARPDWYTGAPWR